MTIHLDGKSHINNLETISNVCFSFDFDILHLFVMD